MPIFLYRLLAVASTRLRGWRLPLLVVGVVFATSWAGMWWAEPADNPITRPEVYWWWFLVTAATVGYGDHYPTTPLGYVMGGYVIVGGIVTLTILFTRLGSHLQLLRGRRMKGLAQIDAAGHTVILGYLAGRTERMIDELCVERDRPLVLCAADDVTEHPVPERAHVRFVRGDLTGPDVMARAGVARAATVIVDGHDDNESLAIALAADHAGPGAHLVVALRDLTRREQLRYIDPAIQCVQWHMPNLVTDEALDPGITEVYADLMSSGGQGNTYSVRVPPELADRTFGECQTQFGRRFGATLIAVRTGGEVVVSPGWDTPVGSAATLYYLAGRRIDEAELRPARSRG